MWLRWMIAAFICNGVCTFGLRILAAHGLASCYTSVYLALWYLCGSLLLFAVYFPRRKQGRWADPLVGGALGLASVLGQTSVGLALSQGLPGSMVYPTTMAGGLFIVVAAGVVLFGERIGPYGIAGVLLGIASIALLSL